MTQIVGTLENNKPRLDEDEEEGDYEGGDDDIEEEVNLCTLSLFFLMA